MKFLIGFILVSFLSTSAFSAYSAGIKVSAAISASATPGVNATSSLYTAPANGYAIIQCTIDADGLQAGSLMRILVDGQLVFEVVSTTTATTYHSSATGSVGTATAHFITSPSGIYVGPSQLVQVQNVSGGSGGTDSARCSGVEFKNQ